MADANPLPPPRPIPAPSAQAQTAGLDRVRSWQIVGLVGSAIVVVGSLGPWATITTAFGSASVAGTSGDGVITLAAAALAAVGFVTAVWLLRWIGSAVALAVGVYDWANIQSRVADVNASDVARASVGWGLWAVVIGAASCLVAAFIVPNKAKLIR